MGVRGRDPALRRQVEDQELAKETGKEPLPEGGKPAETIVSERKM